jgi:catechol 2,3-dioxygenase-like lactoylglutathione lyase family enzyme
MSDLLTTLFNDFDRGRLSRRQLLQALGLAVAATPMSSLAFGQGQCGGARAGTPGCETTPAPPPFESTGWKTVLLDHFSMQVADYQKEAAYFAALMNWKIRSDDGKQAVLDIGDWGGIIIKGGYEPPPTPPTPPTAPAAPTPPAPGTSATPPGGDPGAAGGGRGGARGAGPRAPRLAVVNGFCWGIEPWDAKKVEAELRKRGMDPIADHDKKNSFESFHVKDPNGFDLQISNGNSKNRRTKPATGKVAAPAPFEPTPWKTVWLDHISFEVGDYKAGAAFYQALLGWKPGNDEGSQNTCQIGDVGGVIIRRGGGGNRGAAAGAPQGLVPVERRAGIGHISFGITPWDPDAVKAELTKRNLSAREDTGGRGDIHTAKYQSYHTTTPNGYDLQISITTKASRNEG